MGVSEGEKVGVSEGENVGLTEGVMVTLGVSVTWQDMSTVSE